MNSFILQRYQYHKTGVAGIWTAFNKPDIFFYTLERPWLNNLIDVSCIIAGTYKVERIIVENGIVYRLCCVPSRTGINIHPANYYYELEGCIATGMELLFRSDILHIRGGTSRPAFEYLNKLTEGMEEFQLTVSDSPMLIDWIGSKDYETLIEQNNRT